MRIVSSESLSNDYTSNTETVNVGVIAPEKHVYANVSGMNFTTMSKSEFEESLNFGSIYNPENMDTDRTANLCIKKERNCDSDSTALSPVKNKVDVYSNNIEYGNICNSLIFEEYVSSESAEDDSDSEVSAFRRQIDVSKVSRFKKNIGTEVTEEIETTEVIEAIESNLVTSEFQSNDVIGDLETKKVIEELLTKEVINEMEYEASSSGMIVEDEEFTEKLIHNKRKYCFYCKRPFAKIARHLEHAHKEEHPVREAFAYPKYSKERKFALEKILRLGNFQHNADVLDTGVGDLVVLRRPKESRVFSAVYTDYKPCQYCLGFVHKDRIRQHTKTCPFSKEVQNNHSLPAEIHTRSSKPAENQVRQIRHRTKVCRFPKDVQNIHSLASETSTASLMSSAGNQTNYPELLIFQFRDKDIKRCIMNDNLIYAFGQNQFCKYGSDVTDNIQQEMKMLACLLTEVNKHSVRKFHLAECLCPNGFELLINGIKLLACHSASDGKRHATLEFPSLALKFGNLIKKCANILRDVYKKEENIFKEQQLESFLRDFDLDLSVKISSYVLNTPNTNKEDKDEIQNISTKDSINLRRYATAVAQLTEDETDWLVQRFGDNIKAHREFYRKQKSTVKVNRTSQIGSTIARGRISNSSRRQQTEGGQIPNPSWRQHAEAGQIPNSSWRQQTEGGQISNLSWRQQTEGGQISNPWTQQTEGVQIPNPSWRQQTEGLQIPNPSWRQQTEGLQIPNPSWRQQTEGVQFSNPSWRKKTVGGQISNPSWRHQATVNIDGKLRRPTTRQMGARVKWSEEEISAVKSFFSEDIAKKKVPGRDKCEECRRKYASLEKRPWTLLKFCVKNIINKHEKRTRIKRRR